MITNKPTNKPTNKQKHTKKNGAYSVGDKKKQIRATLRVAIRSSQEKFDLFYFKTIVSPTGLYEEKCSFMKSSLRVVDNVASSWLISTTRVQATNIFKVSLCLQITSCYLNEGLHNRYSKQVYFQPIQSFNQEPKFTKPVRKWTHKKILTNLSSKFQY